LTILQPLNFYGSAPFPVRSSALSVACAIAIPNSKCDASPERRPISCRKKQFELMFSDIVMDGIALARVVRQRRPDLPILLAAGYSQAAGLPSSAGSPGQARR